MGATVNDERPPSENRNDAVVLGDVVAQHNVPDDDVVPHHNVAPATPPPPPLAADAFTMAALWREHRRFVDETRARQLQWQREIERYLDELAMHVPQPLHIQQPPPQTITTDDVVPGIANNDAAAAAPGTMADAGESLRRPPLAAGAQGELVTWQSHSHLVPLSSCVEDDGQGDGLQQQQQPVSGFMLLYTVHCH